MEFTQHNKRLYIMFKTEVKKLKSMFPIKKINTCSKRGK